MEPVDGLAFIGRNPLDSDNVYIATGDSGNGMTHGTIAGMLLTDLIVGPRQSLGRALRSVAQDARRDQGVREGEPERRGAVRRSRHARRGERCVGDRAGRRGDPPARRRRSGRLPRRQGALHERSAVCTHLGCVVRWNSARRRGTARATARGSRSTGTPSTVPRFRRWGIRIKTGNVLRECHRLDIHRRRTRLSLQQAPRTPFARRLVPFARYRWSARSASIARVPLAASTRVAEQRLDNRLVSALATVFHRFLNG